MEVEKMEKQDSSGEKQDVRVSKATKIFETFIQPCLAEVLGTMFFVFIACVSVIENEPETGRLKPALVYGLAMAVSVAMMDKISGSHFNPPFTLAIYLCGGMKLIMVGPYIVCQLIGGILGAAMAKAVTPPDHYKNATGAAFNILKSDSQLPSAIFGEAAMTCMVAVVVLLAAVNSKTKTPLAPVLVGCAVVVALMAGGDVSGACLNPARAFGPAVMTNYWTYHWVYWLGPTGGGLVAVVLLRLLLGDHQLLVILKSSVLQDSAHPEPPRLADGPPGQIHKNNMNKNE